MITTGIFFCLFLVLWFTVMRSAELRQERDEAYDYILSQWRKNLLQQPMNTSLANKLAEYEEDGK